jgi:hypothetical protein
MLNVIIPVVLPLWPSTACHMLCMITKLCLLLFCRMRGQQLLPMLQQLNDSSITAMAAAADGTGSNTITCTVSSATPPPTAAAATAVGDAGTSVGAASGDLLQGIGVVSAVVKQEHQPHEACLPAYAAAALAAAHDGGDGAAAGAANSGIAVTADAAVPLVRVKAEQQHGDATSIGAASQQAAATRSEASPFAAAAAEAAASAAGEAGLSQPLHQQAVEHVSLPGIAAAILGRCGSVSSAQHTLLQVGSSQPGGGADVAAAAAAVAATAVVESAEEGPQGTTTSAAAAAGSLATSSAQQAPSQPSSAVAAAALSGGMFGAGNASMHVSALLNELGFPQLLPLFESEMVDSVGVLALMTRQDYADLKVPKGAALAIMAACKRLMEGQR